MFLGIDIGTSGCKLLVVDSQGQVIAEASREYNLITPKSGWIEQDPEEILEAVSIALGQLSREFQKLGHKMSDMRALAIDSPRDSMIPVDKNGRPLMNCITWMDQRARKQVAELRDRIAEDEVREISGHGIETAFWVPKILWLKNERPNLFEKAVQYLNPASYLLSRLTGETIMHISSASRTMLINRESLAWSERLAALCGITPDLLAPTTKALVVAGETTQEAKELGLPPGIQTTMALSDDHCTAVGIGAIENDWMGVTAATNDAFYLPVDKPLQLGDSGKGVGCTPHLIAGKWLQHFSISSTSGSLRWFRDNFCYEEMEKGEETGISAYVYMDKLAEEVELGSDGLFFYPYLWGGDVPVFDEDARGMFFRFTAGHQRKHFIRAILEGVAFQYIGAYDFLNRFNVKIKHVSMAGGGARSALWNQLKSDAILMPIHIPAVSDAAPFGAALVGGVAVGELSNLEAAAKKLVTWKTKFKPSPQNHKKMRTLYAEYMRVYQDVAPYMKRNRGDNT
jgi:sugar (pentulose or hexulose) kinase